MSDTNSQLALAEAGSLIAAKHFAKFRTLNRILVMVADINLRRTGLLLRAEAQLQTAGLIFVAAPGLLNVADQSKNPSSQ
jgi:hypothetical protein